MFNIGGPELLVIFLVALVVLGPTRLPDAARQVGKMMGEFRRLSASFQSEMRQAMEDPVTKAVEAAEAAEPTVVDSTSTDSPDATSDDEADDNASEAADDSSPQGAVPDVTKTAPIPTVAELRGEQEPHDSGSDDDADSDVIAQAGESPDNDTPVDPPMFGDR